RFTRIAWTALAAYALLVVTVFAVTGEMALRRSLEHSADLTQSLLGAYRDSTSEPGGVMPSALADRLVAMGGQVVITRTTTGGGARGPAGGGRCVAPARARGRRDARHRSGGARDATHQSHGPGGSHRAGRQRQPHARAGGPRASRPAGVHGGRESRAAHAAHAFARAGAVGRRRGPQRGGDARRARRHGAGARPDGEARGRAAAHCPRRKPPAGAGAGTVRPDGGDG